MTVEIRNGSFEALEDRQMTDLNGKLQPLRVSLFLHILIFIQNNNNNTEKYHSHPS